MPPAYPPPDVISDISSVEMSREDKYEALVHGMAWIKEELAAITTSMADGSLNEYSIRSLREMAADWSEQRDRLKQAHMDCQKIVGTLENTLSPTPVQTGTPLGPSEPGQLFKSSIAVLKRARAETTNAKDGNRDGAVRLKAVKQELEDQ